MTSNSADIHCAAKAAIRIGLVEDQQLVRQGIASLLAISKEIELVWQAENGEDALVQQARTPVDLLLSDIRMPVLDGIGMLQRLSAKADPVPVIMLTTFDDSQLFVQSMTAGARGFLLKDVSLDKLLDAISQVAAGGYLIEPRLLSREQELKEDGIKPAQPDAQTSLSPRERDILRLVAAGFSNKEIAASVFLAEGTVKNHVSNILTKLECRDRTQAVLKAIRLSLI